MQHIADCLAKILIFIKNYFVSLFSKKPKTEEKFYERVKRIDDLLGIDYTPPRTDGPGYVLFNCDCGLGKKIKVENLDNPGIWECTRPNCRGKVRISAKQPL